MSHHPNLLLSALVLAGCDTAAASFEPAAATGPAVARYQIALEEAPAQGPSDAKVTVLVFTDYQCSFCRKLDPSLDQLLAAHPDDVRIQIANYPLPMHADAVQAALAARAAHEQGRFWEMHRRLISPKSALDRAALVAHAKAIGLEVSAFESALDSRAGHDQLAREAELAKRFGVKGTPALFINGRRVTGVRPYAELEAIVAEEIALGSTARALTASGLTADQGEEQEELACDSPSDCDCAKNQ